MPRPAFPTSLQQFQGQFADEEACRQYLEACRWPDGFHCPRCGHGRAYPLGGWRRECAACRYQVSLTAGTVFHRTKTPLTVWFWAAYLMTTDKRGISALLLQRQLGIRRYETAWRILHKLRRAMVNAVREPFAWGGRTRRHVGGWTAAGSARESATEGPESGARGCGRREARDPHGPWCLRRSLLIRRPSPERTASGVSAARLRQIPRAARLRNIHAGGNNHESGTTR